jgi:hypothetical protein
MGRSASSGEGGELKEAHLSPKRISNKRLVTPLAFMSLVIVVSDASQLESSRASLETNSLRDGQLGVKADELDDPGEDVVVAPLLRSEKGSVNIHLLKPNLARTGSK